MGSQVADTLWGLQPAIVAMHVDASGGDPTVLVMNGAPFIRVEGGAILVRPSSRLARV